MTSNCFRSTWSSPSIQGLWCLPSLLHWELKGMFILSSQRLLVTTNYQTPNFSDKFYKNHFGNNHLKLCEQKIDWVITKVGLRHFLDPKPYEHLHLPPHVILTILIFSPAGFSPQLDSQKSSSEKSWNKQAQRVVSGTENRVPATSP